MVRRLWLFGLILGVPIAGVLAALVTTASMDHPTDSHPPLSLRLQNLGVTLGTVAQPALAVAPDNPAIVLFDAPEKLEEEISSAYQQLLAQHLPASQTEEPAQA